MTPILSAVYDELVARASAPPFSEQGLRWVQGFYDRTGLFPADHPSAPQRLAAAWEDALCRGGLAQQLLGCLEDPAEKQLAGLIPRAHQGLFAFQRHGSRHLLHDVVSGAMFLLVARDSIGREVVGDNLGGLCQGRIVGAVDGCALLPGVVFHEADATTAIHDVLRAAHDQKIPADQLWEGLLRMDFKLCTQSRIRPTHAYRADALRRSSGLPVPRA